VGKSSAVFNPEKLIWLNSQYVMSSDPVRLAELVIPFLEKEKIIHEGEAPDMEWLSKAILTLRERAKTLGELAASLRYYIAEDVEYNEKAKAKFLHDKSLPLLIELKERITVLAEFSVAEIERIFREITERHGIKLGNLAQPVRVAVTGGTESPGIFEVLEVMGKEKTMRRLEKAILAIERSGGKGA
jgi:glutamyl-tRNA synthetase